MSSLTLPEGLLVRVAIGKTEDALRLAKQSVEFAAGRYKERTGKVADAIECSFSEVERWSWAASDGYDLLPSAACPKGTIRVGRLP